MSNSPDDMLKRVQLFMPYAFEKHQQALAENRRFVHYTSAATATSIIKNKKIWMRNATCMNDFMEVKYGFDCLVEAYNADAGIKFRQLLDAVFPGLKDEIEALFNSYIFHFKTDTYLTCISEHENDEDAFGRLSMWRAYGGDSGVALVLNNKALLAPSDALRAYTYPVAYSNAQGVMDSFNKITENLSREVDFLKLQDRNIIKDMVFNLFKFITLCVKHPGFKEEKEWRVVYSPAMQSKHLTKEVLVVNGTPQPIYKIPLADIPDENFFGASIPDLIERVIIGPTEYASTTFRALVDLLAEAGVVDAEKKVFISAIPLRH